MTKRTAPRAPGNPTDKSSVDGEIDAGSRRAQLNLTITEAELWEFREWCVRHRIKQQDAFREAFAMLRKQTS